MADSQDDVRDHQSIHAATRPKINGNNDEIDLAVYLRIIWKRRYFILCGSVLPTLLVGLIFFLLPENYNVTYTYDIKQDREVLSDRLYNAQEVKELISRAQESKPYEYKLIRDRFYSSENMNRLAAQLMKGRSSGKYPPELLKTNVKLDVSGEFLTLTVIGRSQAEVQEISSVARDNFEDVLPIYSVKQELGNAIVRFRKKAAGVKEKNIELELELQKKKAVLAKLKNSKLEESNNISDNIILQFGDVRQNSEYLPLAYQIRAIEVSIINIEETIIATHKECERYNALQNLNERLLKEVDSKAAASYYTLEEFHSFLANVIRDNEDAGSADSLNAYIKRIEDMMVTMRPVVDKPGISLVPESYGAKTATIGAVLLMATILAAFLLENLPQKQDQAV